MKDTDSIDDFVGKISELSSKSASLGTNLEESKLVKKFLTSLPRKKFIHITAALEQVLDLNKTSFEDIVGRLKAYEERIHDEESQEENPEKLMYANYEPQRYQGRGRGRGPRFFGRGRGRGRFDFQRDISKITCYRCDKLGHYASDCPDRLLKLQEAKVDDVEETQEADKLMMHEVVMLNEQSVKPSDFKSHAMDENIWYLDNGASNHMTGNSCYFSRINEEVTGFVKFGDDSRISIKGKGPILFVTKNGDKKVLADVYYVPGLKSNIISLGQATEGGCRVKMNGDILELFDSKDNLLVKARRSQNRLYKVRIEIAEKNRLLKIATVSDSSRWHARLGHINLERLKTMIQGELVTGIPSIEVEKEICESCIRGKQTRNKFPKATQFRAENPLDLIHGDLCGPITPHTPGLKKYLFVLIDDCSRYMWTILLKEKNEAFEKFKNFKGLVERERGGRIKVFRTDRGGEFNSREFNEFCENNEITRHLTAPYTPQQNGVVERRNRTLMDMTRSLLKHMGMPNYFWGEATRHATYLINRAGTRSLNKKTPYECFKGRKPNLAHLKIFGCLCYAKICGIYLRKLDDRSRLLVHLGTEPGSKAYRLYDPITKKIVINRDVIFDEQSGWKWENCKEAATDSSGSLTVEGLVENLTDDERDDDADSNRDDIAANTENRGSASNANRGGASNATDSSAERKEDENVLESGNGGTSYVPSRNDTIHGDPAGLRRSNRQRNSPKYLEDYVLTAEEELEETWLSLDEEPRSFSEAKKSKPWLTACEEEITSIEKNNTWSLVSRPTEMKTIGLKWVFKVKKNSDGSVNKFKARIVAKGYVQQQGVDFEEVFAPVARMETIRLLLGIATLRSWEVHHLDVKTAFLNGELKELVFVEQPEGFLVKDCEDKVYKLNKALYGLRQAPRAWNTKLNEVLKSLNFIRCLKESSVYRKHENGEVLLVAVYVDDLFVTGSCQSMVRDFKHGMTLAFEMSDLGKLTYYLGIEVHQVKGGIALSQERYALKVLHEAGMDDCNACLAPMDSGLKLSKFSSEEGVNKREYRRLIGCLRYLLHTRPDLSYAVGVLSRYMQDPKETHSAALKHVLRYLKGTTSYGLNYKRGGKEFFFGYCDSSHNIDPDDGKSTSGYVFFFGDNPVSWCSSKQETVALSSCEAEFMSATEAAKQAIWLQELLGEIVGTEAKSVVVRIDNKSAIALTKNPVFHGRSKHIHSRYHFIRECVEKGLIEVEHVPGINQKADILTKALGRIRFGEMRKLIGVEFVSKDSKLEGENVDKFE